MISIRRLNVSKYQSSNYQENEARALEKLGFKYLDRNETNSTADIWITNSKTDFEDLPPFLQREREKLKLIIHPNSGYDNFSPEWVQKTDTLTIVGNPIRAEAVAEWTLAQVFSRFALSPHQSQWDKHRQWHRGLISEAKVLLIGHGHIGKLVASTLSPLCSEENLDIFDPYLNTTSNEQVENLTLPVKQNRYEILLLCCSLNPFNKHMVNKNFLSSLPSNVLIVNGARGGLINTEDLSEFLKQNPQAYASLDVFENEPDDLYHFNTYSNIRLSSHIAGVHKQLDDKILQFVENVSSQYLHFSNQDQLKKFEQLFKPLLLKNRLRKAPEGKLFLC